MIVELSKPEVELLDAALKEWANAPIRDGMGSSLLGVMLAGREENYDREETKSRVQKEMEDCQKRSAVRERQALLLRAKLAQAEVRESEHTT
jgi:hypothetical protein